MPMTARFYRKGHAALAALWLALVLVLGIHLAVRVQHGMLFDSDLLSLLPAEDADAGTQRAVDAVSNRLRQQAVFLVRSTPPVDARAAADRLERELRASGLFESLQYRLSDTEQSALARALFPHHVVLLADADRAALQQQQFGALLTRALHDVSNPLLPLNADLLQADPLLLFPRYVSQLSRTRGRLALHDGALEYRDDDEHVVQIVAQLRDGAFDITNHDRYRALLLHVREVLASEFDGTQLISAGIINHAASASAQARGEVGVIGIGSTVGVLLLMLLVFRSLRPLWLSLLVIGVGLGSALSVSLFVFERLHVMTLVFGASLIGVLDYSLHFLVDERDAEHAGANTRWYAFDKVRSGLLLSMATNVTAYLAMLLAPFPGLRQVAVFSAVGLASACLCVLLWFPYLAPRKIAQAPLRGRTIARWWLQCWDNMPRAIVPAACALFVLLLAWVVFAPVDDDVRRLQHTPAELQQQDAAVQSLTGVRNDSQFFLVRGDSIESVLQREEQLRGRLDVLVAGDAAVLQSYTALSQALPSQQRQRETLALLQQGLAQSSADVARYVADIGFNDDVMRDYQRSVGTFSDFLQPQSLLALPSFPFRHLLVTTGDGEFASVILLTGIHDLARVRAAADGIHGVKLVDHVAAISALLGDYRVMALLLAGVAYLLAAAVLSWRYGWRKALLVLCPPALAALIALTVSSWCALPINLFNALSMLVIMGVGIDYTLFFAEDRSDRENTMMAVLLACLTTELSFGLLALSETPVVRSFGLTMCIGIACALLLAPMASLPVPDRTNRLRDRTWRRPTPKPAEENP